MPGRLAKWLICGSSFSSGDLRLLLNKASVVQMTVAAVTAPPAVERSSRTVRRGSPGWWPGWVRLRCCWRRRGMRAG